MYPSVPGPYSFAPVAYIGPTLPGAAPPPSVAPAPSKATPAEGEDGGAESKKHKPMLRMAGGMIWEDASLADWPEDDYRVFVGDLGNEVNDEILQKAFSHYPSLLKVKVIQDKVTKKSKGFGFVSLGDPMDFLKCLKEMNGVYIGNRPCKIKKSNWKKKDLETRVKSGKGYVHELVDLQSKGTGAKYKKKRKARPDNANRDVQKDNAKKPRDARDF